ncbi:hypothetical protein LTR53_006916, partial [Teratosphaeriaceae sp. CCFEE 6253]
MAPREISEKRQAYLESRETTFSRWDDHCLQAARDRITDLEADVGKLQDESSAMQSGCAWLTQERTAMVERATAMELEIGKAKSRAAEAEKKIAGAAAKAGEAVNSVVELGRKSIEREARAAEAESKIGGLKAEVTDLRGRMASVSVKATAAAKLLPQVSQLERQAAGAEEKGKRAETRIAELEKQVAGAEAKVAKAE